ncbi:MAG: hypothetical protein LBU32_17130 [Clostridiales bacterium]|nr:hypothetical protein [Clostridiales bacterium]
MWDTLRENEQFVLPEFYLNDDDRQIDAIRNIFGRFHIERSSILIISKFYQDAKAFGANAPRVFACPEATKCQRNPSDRIFILAVPN